MFAFEQCLLCLGHHPHVWYEAALFLQTSAKTLSDKGDVTASKNLAEEVANIYERAINGPLSHNALLYFAYSDYEEGRIKYEKAHQIYAKYLEQPDIDPTLGYIQYMRFARRAEGIKSARLVFKRSRQDPRCSSHVYVAAALMEYYCTKDKNIAFKIFDLGLKRFKHQPEYLLSYVEFLKQLNEDNNTRMVPFKPKMQWTPGEHIAPGGCFPLPPAAAQLCGMLPPPNCFHGPFVMVDPVMELIKHLAISESGVPLANTPENIKLFDMARSVHWLPKDATTTADRPVNKRRGVGDESDEEDAVAVGSAPQQVGPPPNDIYRKRQQKRVK
nr:EOG090X026K [Ilyocryptus agilis]